MHLPIAEISISAGDIVTAIAVISGISAWVIIPRRVDDHEKRIEEIEKKQSENDKTIAELKTSMEFVRETVEKIAQKLNVV